jgi:chromosome segregation ATPase
MKYEAGVKARLEESENQDKEIKRNSRKGKSALKVQIAKLDSAIVEAEENVETAEENYKASKFAMPFDIKKIDAAEIKFKQAKAELESLNEDLDNRKTLLKELF